MGKTVWALVFFGILTMGCAVIPATVQKEALSPMPFPELIQHADKLIGETLILGGYVLSIQKIKGEARMVVMQVPLDAHQKPTGRKLSQGLIILTHAGSFNLEKYPRESKITVAGILLGSSATNTVPSPYPCIELRMTHIYLWPD